VIRPWPGCGAGAFRAAALAVLAALAGCGNDDATRVSLAEREKVVYPLPSAAPLRFAVGAMLTPRAAFAQYAELLHRVGAELGRPLRLVDRPSYAAVNEAIEDGEVDAAFVCSGPYVEGRRAFGLELLAVPVVNGERTYRSLVIVHADSPFATFGELRGHSFAFTDPESNSGALVPRHLLAGLGETPESFFSKTVLSGSHDRSILAVRDRIVDAAAVDSLIWEAYRRTGEGGAEETRVIWASEPYGIPPVVVRPDLDPSLKLRLREIFLGLHRDARGAELLAAIGIERFVEGRDEDYDSIRAMAAALRGSSPETGPGNAGGQP